MYKRQERTSGYLILAKMNDATATSAVEGFSAAPVSYTHLMCIRDSHCTGRSGS
nr:hypothetical protein [Pseudomonas sp. HS-2]